MFSSRFQAPLMRVFPFRNWHVSVLLEAYPSTETLVPGELYSLAISRESVRVVVLIELPESFPNTAPLVSCTPSFRHEWLNATSGQVVAHPALSRWTPPGVANGTTSVLVAVIRDLEAAIAASPKTESLKSPPPRQTLLSFGTVDTSYEKTLGGNDLMVIDALSPEHVSELLAAEEKLDKFISNLPASRQHTAVLDEMLEENIKVARTPRQRLLFIQLLTGSSPLGANLRIRDETMDLKQTLDSALKDYDLAIESFNNFLLLHAEQLKVRVLVFAAVCANLSLLFCLCFSVFALEMLA
jgi:hypothetical protein